jgi:GAF domain-containing protein
MSVFENHSISTTLLEEYKSLLTGRWITDLANTSAFIFSEIKNLNWSGFYLLENDELILGPFQGLPACTQIALGKGVCGKAAMDKKTILVENVHEFPGHIACDARSKSEIVVPLILNNKILGVLDVDSPIANRFHKVEQDFFESVVRELLKSNKQLF